MKSLVVVPEPQKEWEKICLALDHREWITDERFPDIRSIMRCRDEVTSLFSAAIKNLTLEEVDARFRE